VGDPPQASSGRTTDAAELPRPRGFQRRRPTDTPAGGYPRRALAVKTQAGLGLIVASWTTRLSRTPGPRAG
jgi:hypothetical protein